jgi:homoaconitate hydratase
MSQWQIRIELIETDSFGNICSAATVAASSFGMSLVDPHNLLADVDPDVFVRYLSAKPFPRRVIPGDIIPLEYVEPHLQPSVRSVQADVLRSDATSRVIKGKVQVLPDFVDTDAVGHHLTHIISVGVNIGRQIANFLSS